MRNGPETGRIIPSTVGRQVAKFAGLALAALVSSGCTEGPPTTGFGTYKKAKECLTDPSSFPDIHAECQDTTELVEKVLERCGLQNGDTKVRLGTSEVTVRSRAEEAVSEVCSGKK